MCVLSMSPTLRAATSDYPLTGRGGWHPTVPADRMNSALHPYAKAKCAQKHAAQHSTSIEYQGGAAASTSGHRPQGVLLPSEVRTLANILVGLAVGPEHPVPEEVNHGEGAVRMQMMGEVKPPLAPEPAKRSRRDPST